MHLEVTVVGEGVFPHVTIEHRDCDATVYRTTVFRTTIHRTTIYRTTVHRNDSLSKRQFIEPTVYRADSLSNQVRTHGGAFEGSAPQIFLFPEKFLSKI